MKEKFSFMLAPMEDTTDNALRELCFIHGADLTMTEMVKVESLLRKNPNSMQKLSMKGKAPCQIQISGGDLKRLEEFFKWWSPEGNFKGFNLNLGCPSKKSKKNDIGCGMMNDIKGINAVEKLIRSKGFNFSIKMRLGKNAAEKEEKIYLKVLKETNADFYVIHARHGNEKYKKPADFSVYEKCVATEKKIIANGDINSIEQIKWLKKIGCVGVMMGRYAVYNPAIFNELKEKKIPDIEKLKEEYLKLFEKYPNEGKYKRNVLLRMGDKRSLLKNKVQLKIKAKEVFSE